MSSPRTPWEYENPACRDPEVAELFFLDDKDEVLPEEEAGRGDYAAAKAICRVCPHVAECREWGIAHEGFGIWGAMSPHERSTVRRRLNIIIDTPSLSLR